MKEFEQLYSELFPGEKWKCMTCPMMTRWYTVGLGAKQVLKEWERLKVMAKKIRQAYSAESAANKCASALTSLLAEPGLKTHVEFICAYDKTWWNRHFLWLQSTDNFTKSYDHLKIM